MRYAPSGFIGATDLPLQFLGGNAVASAGHQIHGEKPMCQLSPGFLKDSSDTRVNVMAASVAGITPALGHLVEFGEDFAGRADKLCPAILHLHDSIQASTVIGKFGLELLERVFHGLSPCLLGIR
jgi:hypothetical protein